MNGNSEISTHPVKVLPYKTYNKIGHLSKSKLGEGDHTIDQSSENQLTKACTDPTAVIIVQEKLDGTNVCVVRWKGEIVCLGRSGYDLKNSDQEQHRMFHVWVREHLWGFNKLLPNEEDRIVGEWLALAHGTKYEFEHNPFVPFDLYRGGNAIDFISRERLFSEYGIWGPVVLHIGGACSINRGLKILEKGTYHNADHAEGLIYRMERPGKPAVIAKYVKQTHQNMKYLKEGEEKVWNWRP